MQPVPVKDVNYKELTIHPTPEEYFLLSRITGTLTVAEICQVSSQSRAVTLAALNKLIEAGLLRVPGALVSSSAPNFGAETITTVVSPADPQLKEAQAKEQRYTTPPTQDDRPQGQWTQGTRAVLTQPLGVDESSGVFVSEESSPQVDVQRWQGWPANPSTFECDASLFASAPELDAALRQEAALFYAFMDQVDYYQLLGVARDAGRKEIKKAYFSYSKKYHPDRFYGKGLGGFEGKIDTIFQKLNKAYQSLSNTKKRADYDAHYPPKDSEPVLSVVSETSSQKSAMPSSMHNFAVLNSESSVAYGLGEHEASRRKREMAFGVLMRRGEKHESLGEYGEAAGEYRKAFAIKNESSVALRGANLLMRCGESRHEEAILLAKAAAAEDKENIKPLLLIGDIYEEREEYADALRYYERAQQIDPEHKTVQRRIEYLSRLID